MSYRIKVLTDSDSYLEEFAMLRKWSINQWELTDGIRYKRSNKFLIKLQNDNGEGVITFIPISPHGLCFAPRTGELQDTSFYYGSNPDTDRTPAIQGFGWMPQNEGFSYIPYLRDEVFPLSNQGSPDSSYRTGVVFDGDSFAHLDTSSNFGNIYWSSYSGSEVVSWEGSPFLYWKDEYKSYSETYKSFFYDSGELIDGPLFGTGGNFILGASKPNGVYHLVCYHRTADPLTEGGAFITVSKWGLVEDEESDTGELIAGWQELYRTSGYDGLPYLPDQTGYHFLKANGSMLSIENDVVTKTDEKPSYSGISHDDDMEWSEVSSGGIYSSFEFSYPETETDTGLLDEDTPPFLVKNVSGSYVMSATKTTGGTSSTDTASEYDVYNRIVAPDSTTIVGDSAISVGSTYSLSGAPSYCDVQWTVPLADFDQVGNAITITSISGCGENDIVATISGGAVTGSFTKTLQYPTGVNIRSSCEDLDPTVYGEDKCTSAGNGTAWPPYSPCWCNIRNVDRGGTDAYYATSVSTTYLPDFVCPDDRIDELPAGGAGSGCTCDPGYTGNAYNCWLLTHIITYSWVCP